MRTTDPSKRTNRQGETDPHPLPDGTERVFWVGEEFILGNVQDYDPELFGADDEAELQNDEGEWLHLEYDHGDEMPIPVAEDIWHSSMKRYLACFDADMNHLRAPDRQRTDYIDRHAPEIQEDVLGDGPERLSPNREGSARAADVASDGGKQDQGADDTDDADDEEEDS